MIITALIIWLYMTGWYVVSLFKKRNDIADTAWGLGFIVVTLYSLATDQSIKMMISAVLISVWGLRLAIHIYQRNKHRKEDARYAQFSSSPYLKVFMTQGFLMWLIAWPVINSQGAITWFNLIGVIIWLIGFYFESRADQELRVFLQDPQNKGKIMQSGLWAYSRHPNYFGEVTMWWGIWLLNLHTNWWTVIGPVTITYLILKVSGVPLLEKKYENNQEFIEYKKRVPVFVPWWPKKYK